MKQWNEHFLIIWNFEKELWYGKDNRQKIEGIFLLQFIIKLHFKKVE